MNYKERTLLREVIEDILKIEGRGMTHAQLKREIPGWSPNFYPSGYSIGQMLRRMVEQGALDMKGDSFMLPRNNNNGKVHSPSNVQPYQPQQPVQSNPVGQRVELSPFTQKRSGRTITIEQEPTEHGDVARVELCIRNVWFPITLFSDIRICTGPGIPKWHEAQESYENVEWMRIVFKDGNAPEFPCQGRTITIAPKED